MPTINVYIKDEDLVEKVEKDVESGKFRNKSHALEVALQTFYKEGRINIRMDDNLLQRLKKTIRRDETLDEVIEEMAEKRCRHRDA